MWLWNELTKLGWFDSVGDVGLEPSGRRVAKQIGVQVEVRKVKLRVTRIRSVLRKGRSEVSFQRNSLEKSQSVKFQQKTTSDGRNVQETFSDQRKCGD